MTATSEPLAELTRALDDCGERLDIERAAELLQQLALAPAHVAALTGGRAEPYDRRHVVRRARFEIVVITLWPGQRTAPHDHGESACARRIVRGTADETLYTRAIDGLVDASDRVRCDAGAVAIDRERRIHALANRGDAAEPAVAICVYLQPLSHLGCYRVRASGDRAPGFGTRRAGAVPCVAIVGGGFSGLMTAAQLMRGASERGRKLDLVLCDRQPAIGAGIAYRTSDHRHWLNVPAGRMSAWSDRPAHLLAWARARGHALSPGDFLERRRYGEYLHDVLHEIAGHGGDARLEIRRGDVTAVTAADRGWRVDLADGAPLAADAVVLAVGHRVPDDPLASQWRGPRDRLLTDPWAPLALRAIAPDEPVLLLGTGLTAIDTLLSLTAAPRTAPIIALSRHGMLPHAHAHAAAPVPPADVSRIVAQASRADVTIRALIAALRAEIAGAADWRAVIDALRPHAVRLWQALPPDEAARFLRHARRFWEIHRHRMPPHVARLVAGYRDTGQFRPMAGRVIGAAGDPRGVTLQLLARGATAPTELRCGWVVNCTGPGALVVRGQPPLDGLIAAGHLEVDPHRLGVVTGAGGEAIAGGRVRSDLRVLGTLCKPRLWESTAVPELREQAAIVARGLLDDLEPRRGYESPPETSAIRL